MNIRSQIRGIMFIALLTVSALSLTGCSSDQVTNIIKMVVEIAKGIAQINVDGTNDTTADATADATVDDTTRTSNDQVEFYCEECGKTEKGDPNNPPSCCGTTMVQVGSTSSESATSSSTSSASSSTSGSSQVEFYCEECGKTEMGDPGNPPSCCGTTMVQKSGSTTTASSKVYDSEDEDEEDD